MNYKEIINLINNVIEIEFQHVAEIDLKDLDSEILDKYNNYTSEIIKLENKICDNLNENLRNDFLKIEDLILKQLYIEIHYYFKKGVISGTTNLNFLKDTNLMQLLD